MAFLLRRERWRSAPSGPVEIDYSHPLARGLAWYQIAGESNRLPPLLVGSAAPSPTSSGMGVRMQGYGNYVDLRENLSAPTEQASGLFIAAIHDFSTETAIFTTAGAGLNSAYYAGHHVTAGTNFAAHYGSGSSNGPDGRRSVGTPALVVLDRPHTFGFSCHGPTDWRLLFDNAFVSPSYSGYAGSYGPGDASWHASIGLRKLWSVSGHHTFLLGAFWHRALSDGELRAISEAPYQILRPRNRRIVLLSPSFDALVFTAGPDAAAFGAASLRNQREYLAPTGAAAPPISSAAWVSHLHRHLHPAGPDVLVPGQPTAINKNRKILAGGIVAPTWAGEHTVEHYGRILAPSGFVASLFGQHLVADAERFLGIGQGVAAPGIGQPWASHSPRWLQPDGVLTDAPGWPRVGGTLYLAPSGWDASRFGERIIPEVQRAYPSGPREEWGDASVMNRLVVVSPPGFQSTIQEQYRFGRAHAWNLRQYVTQQFDPADALNPPPWPQWTAIENRNRVIAAIGAPPPRPPRPEVFNNARALEPYGMDPPGHPGAARSGMVSYATRSIATEGVESVPMSGWSAVFNNARVVEACGADATLLGRARVENTRRYFGRIGNIEPPAISVEAFVSHAIRSVAIESRYAIAPLDIRLPEVKLHTRYIDAIGFETERGGVPDLAIHRSLVSPRWPHRDHVGEPWVRNLTPEIASYGACAEAFGTAAVRLQFRTVSPHGTDAAILPKPVIADSLQRIYVGGVHLLRVSDKLGITRMGGNPYFPQNVIVGSVSEGAAFGEPALNEQRMKPDGIAPPTGQIGLHWAALSGGKLNGFIATGFGDTFVSLLHREIRIETGILLDTEQRVASPRLSPHTVWAVKEATDQAKDNHPPQMLHYVGETSTYPPGERFGSARIGNRASKIGPIGSGVHSALGVPEIGLRRQYLAVSGFRPFRMGWVRVSDGRDEIVQFGSHDSAEFGEATVRYAPYLGPQSVFAPGVEAPDLPAAHWIANFNRTLEPVGGFDALRMGSSREDGAYQWQSLHVGEPLPTVPNGFNGEAHGLTWVSLRVREVHPGGFDSLLSDYASEDFLLRMRVRRGASVAPAIQRQDVAAVGVPAAPAGAPNIRLHTQYIRPDGNAEQFRKGAF